MYKPRIPGQGFGIMASAVDQEADLERGGRWQTWSGSF
jgi:hypothetical protein